ncbi:MAG: hypothetical protein AAGF12_30045 [Myxococcota bacterium]
MRSLLLFLILVWSSSSAAAQGSEPSRSTDSWAVFALESGMFLTPVIMSGLSLATCANDRCEEPAVVIAPAVAGLALGVGGGAGLASLGSSSERSQRIGWGLTGVWPGLSLGALLSMAGFLSAEESLDGVSAVGIGTAAAAGGVLFYLLYHALGAREARSLAALVCGWSASFVGAMVGLAVASLGGYDSRRAGLTLGYGASAGMALGTALGAVAF